MFFFESDLNPWGDRAGPIQKLPGAEVGNGTGPATGGKGGRGTIAWSVGGRPATLRCVTHTAADWGLRGCEQGFSKGLPPPLLGGPTGWLGKHAGGGKGYWVVGRGRSRLCGVGQPADSGSRLGPENRQKKPKSRGLGSQPKF